MIAQVRRVADRIALSWEQLPPSLQLMVVALIPCPLLLAVLIALRAHILLEAGPFVATLTLLSAVALPLAMGICLWLRHSWFLICFALEGLALVAGGLPAFQSESAATPGLRIGIGALFILVGLVVLRRDFIVPLLAKGRHPWRRAPRVYGNVKLFLKSAAGDGKRIAVIVENISMTGIALSGVTEQVAPVFDGLDVEDDLTFQGTMDGQEFEFDAAFRWQRDDGRLRAAGFRVYEPATMSTIIRYFGIDAKAPAHRRIADRIWRIPAIRGAVIYLWCLAVISAMVLAISDFFPIRIDG